MDAQAYLEDRLQAQIDWHESKSGWNQRMFKRLQTLVIAASALLPFAAGFQQQLPGMSWVVGGLGVLVAIVTGIVSLYRFQELWVDYRLTAEALQQEKFRYLTTVPPYDGENRLAVLVTRVEAVLAEQNAQWQQLSETEVEPEKRGAEREGE